MVRFIKRLVSAPVLVLLVGYTPGCIIDSSVDDFAFELPEKTFQVDTGTYEPQTLTDIQCAAGSDTCSAISADLSCNTTEGFCEVTDSTKVPSVSCDAENDPCPSLGPGVYCDTEAGLCAATVPFELVNSVHLASEVDALQEVGQSSFTTVRLSYLRVIVDENTFALDTPPVDLYLAPDTVASLFVPGSNPPTLNPEVQKLGTVPSIPAGTSGITQDVPLTSGGESALTEYLKTPEQPFHVFAYSELTVMGGDPLPQGALTLRLTGEAIVGLN